MQLKKNTADGNVHVHINLNKTGNCKQRKDTSDKWQFNKRKKERKKEYFKGKIENLVDYIEK